MSHENKGDRKNENKLRWTDKKKGRLEEESSQHGLSTNDLEMSPVTTADRPLQKSTTFVLHDLIGLVAPRRRRQRNDVMSCHIM